MPEYAYLAINPNTAHDDTWFSSHQTPVYHCIKIGHTAQAAGGRANAYNTHNPSIFTRMLQFNDPLPVSARNHEIDNRNADGPPQVIYPITHVGAGSTLALFLQRWCLQGSFQKGGTANEWFVVPNRLDRIVALINKLEEDADAEDEPREFLHEGEFCLLFRKIMFD